MSTSGGQVSSNIYVINCVKSRHGDDRMVVEVRCTYAISAYHHYSWELHFRSLRGVLDTTLCDKVCQ